MSSVESIIKDLDTLQKGFLPLVSKIISLILISMLISTTVIISEASNTLPAFTVDGKVIVFNESTGFPYVNNIGRTMMPLRVSLNSIDCDVYWNQQTQTVETRKGDIEVDVPIGKNEIRINQMMVLTDTVSIIKDGRTYLPLRAIMEAYGYSVFWDSKTVTVSASSKSKMEFTPFNINGGTTGVFSRKQLQFEGFDGVQADITLPMVTLAEKGDCPYLYFGFDWKNDAGNVEGGFQFIEDSNHPGYNKWTVFMRQGNDWRWGENISLEQGSIHNLKFYSLKVTEKQVDLVIELDGREIIRKVSTVIDFSNASVKAVTAMAMTKTFDGTNCLSRAVNSKIANLKVSPMNSDQYLDFKKYELYSEWRPTIGAGGTWFGTVDCIPSYLHNDENGSISIYAGTN